MAVSFSDYRALASYPGAAAPMAASALGRFPIAMVGLANLLYLQRSTGSFAAAGAVAAAGVAGVSAGSVVQGRVIDRLGPTRPLLVATALFAGAVTGLIVSVERAAPLPALIALSALTGVLQPALFGASRALWTTLVPPGTRREAALTYEAVSLEVFFILGPAAAAGLVAAPWAGTAVVVAALAVVIGTAWFAVTPVVRRQAPIAGVGGTAAGGTGAGGTGAGGTGAGGTGAGGTGVGGGAAGGTGAGGGGRAGAGAGALRTPGMRTVTLASLGFGLVVGVVEVGVPATTAAAGRPALAGVLLSGWSVASVLFGLLYALRPWPRELRHRMPALLAGFGLTVALMAPGGELAGLLGVAAAMLLAGCLLTPQVTVHSLAVELSAPPGTATEAFGWVVTAATLGIAVGQGTAGALVELVGPPGAFLAGGCAGTLLAGVLWLRRSTLDARGSVPAGLRAPSR